MLTITSKLSGSNGGLKNVRLNDGHILPVAQVSVAGFHGQTQIQGHNVSAPSTQDLRVSPCPTTGVQHPLLPYTLGREAQRLSKKTLGSTARLGIQLCALMKTPLKPEVSRVGFITDESGNPSDDRIRVPTRGTAQGLWPRVQRPFAKRAT
jgi:hypothetical protein